MAGLTREQIAEKKAAEAKAQEENVMAAVDAKIAEMLKAAEEKAQAIIEAAEKKAVGESTRNEEIEKLNAEMEKYVTVKLFKDSGKYKDDVFVAVNGEGCIIPRGVPVQIKKKFAAVLEQSDMQDYQTAQYMEAEAEKFVEASKQLNL